MRFVALDDNEKKMTIELDDTESGHLLSILLHAKFSEDVRLEVVGSPTMQGLLQGLLETRETLGFKVPEPSDWVVHEVDGVLASRSFILIEEELQRLLKRENVANELAEYLYPWTWIKRSGTLPPE